MMIKKGISIPFLFANLWILLYNKAHKKRGVIMTRVKNGFTYKREGFFC